MRLFLPNGRHTWITRQLKEPFLKSQRHNNLYNNYWETKLSPSSLFQTSSQMHGVMLFKRGSFPTNGRIRVAPFHLDRRISLCHMPIDIHSLNKRRNLAQIWNSMYGIKMNQDSKFLMSPWLIDWISSNKHKPTTVFNVGTDQSNLTRRTRRCINNVRTQSFCKCIQKLKAIKKLASIRNSPMFKSCDVLYKLRKCCSLIMDFFCTIYALPPIQKSP